MRIANAAIVALSLLIIPNVNAATAIKEQQNSSVVQIDQRQPVVDQEEAKSLKIELRLIKSFQDNLLSTVYWSLGTLASIAVLLVGFGWFANFRIYERDRAALLQELKNERTQRSKELERHRDELERARAELSRELGSQVAIETARLEESIPKLIAQKTDDTFKELKEHHQRERAALHHKTDELAISILELEYKYWSKEGVHQNALTSASSILRKVLMMKSDWYVASALESIHKSLLGIAGTNRGMFASDISSLVKLVDQASGEHAIVVRTIKDILQRISVM